MQLKIKRTQREGGMLSKTVIFCLDARVDFTPEELSNLRRYKLEKEVVYNSEASKRHLANVQANTAQGTMTGALKGAASLAFAVMNLNITVAGLQQGQHIECKSMEELLGAEDAVISACQQLRAYLDAAATFDGRESVIEFAPEPALVAQATPQERLLASA